MPKYKVKIKKPWIAYPGSLIQQNHGEDIKKGYLVWDIEDKKHWDVEWKHLVNMAPYTTIEWKGTIQKTIDDYKALHKTYAFMPGSRFRVVSKNIIPQSVSKKLVELLVNEHEAEEVIFKTDIVSRMDQINTGGIKFLKKSLARDPNAVLDLYKKFVEVHKESYNYSDIDNDFVKETINQYLSRLSKNIETEVARDVTWTIKYLKFDNLFAYGEDNYVDFTNHKNIVGIFGRNRIGKSSIVGALVYTLFNTTDRGPIKNNHIINDAKDYCSAEARITVGADDYIIQRRSDREKKKGGETSKTTVNFWKIRNDGCQEVKVSNNGISGPDTDAIIRQKIGTAEDFLLTAFASQGKLNRFIENKATKRKEYLNRFLDLDIFNKLYTFASEDYTKLNNIGGNYSVDRWNFDYDAATKSVEKIESQLETINEKLVASYDKKDKLKFWLTEQEKKASSVDKDSIAEIENHIKALDALIVSLTQKLNLHDVELKETKRNLKLAQKKQEKIDIQSLKDDLASMEKLTKSINSLSGSLKIEESSLVQQENSVMKLKVVPCGNQFPTCHFIKDGHEAKNTIADQRKMVKVLGKSVTEATKAFDKYARKNIQKSIDEYEELKSQIPIYEASIKSISSLLEYDTQLLKSKKTQLRTTKSKLSKTKSLMKSIISEEYDKKKMLLSTVEQQIKDSESEKSNLLITLGSKKNKIETLLEEKSHNKDLIKKLNMLNSIQQAFSKNGIPAMVLMSQLPAINKELSRILNNVVDFNIALETDVNSNVMDIFIEDGKSKRLIELGSGMEKTICSIALRVALGNLSSLARPDILILDESFGALDAENLSKGMELLSLFSGYFKAIYVITHISEIKETANKIIEIQNNGIESKIRA